MNKANKIAYILQLIAGKLGLSLDDYKASTRERNKLDLRFIAIHLLRKYFDRDVTLNQLAIIMEYKDHTSISNAYNTVEGYIECNDEKFMVKYNLCLNEMNEWLKANNIPYSQKTNNGLSDTL